MTGEKQVTDDTQTATRTVCPYCTTVFDTFDDLKAHVVAVHTTDPLPKPDGLIQLTVNGQTHELMVAPQWTLYQVIHDRLGLTGVKMFCDRGACGSCTVIMEGRPILSCMMLAIECDGKTIETAEGIAQAGHPLVESYIKHHTMQCGYCTPGFITTAKALLDKNPDPTVQETMQALGGNLCRCGTYPQHPVAVREAAGILKEDQSK
jgi:aerobic-type carbon monoxide dehydrogenase small subunit (CoxS/CutS family)